MLIVTRGGARGGRTSDWAPKFKSLAPPLIVTLVEKIILFEQTEENVELVSVNRFSVLFCPCTGCTGPNGIRPGSECLCSGQRTFSYQHSPGKRD